MLQVSQALTQSPHSESQNKVCKVILITSVVALGKPVAQNYPF